MQQRLQKILSERGVCSRRKAEEYIEQGLVTVNGKKAVLGQKADPLIDEVRVDGQVMRERQKMLYYVMHKPLGVVTSNTPGKTSPTVRDLLPKNLQGKIFPIGRLDKDSSGLLLLTNDGVLAYRLTHPKFFHEKEYEVSVEKPVPDGVLEKLRSGLMILGTKTKLANVRRLSGRRFSIALTEGRNRQIRRMCQKVGYPVKHLHRFRIVTLHPQLRESEVRELTKAEVHSLLKAVGLE